MLYTAMSLALSARSELKMAMTPSPETHEIRSHRADCVVLLTFVLILTAPFWIHLRDLPAAKDPDALQSLAFARIFVDAVWNHHQFPLWNPYFGGGVPWAGMVWNPGLTPLSIILTSFGEVIGFKVWFALVLLGGSMGMYRICGDTLRTSRVAALLCALLFSGSLWAAGRLEDGNYYEFGLLLLPLCIHAFHQFLSKGWVGFLLPLFYLAILGMSRYEAFLIALFVLVFALLFHREMQASYSKIVFSWLGTFTVFVILSLPKLLPLLDVLAANTAKLQITSPSGMRQSWFVQSIIYSPEILPLIPRFFSDHIKLLAVTMHPRHLIGIKITASFLVLAAGILKPRQSARLWVILAFAFILICGPYAPLPFWRLLLLLPVFNTMNDFTKYWNVFALFTLCILAALGFDAILQLIGRTFSHPGRPMVQKVAMGAIFFIATLHPFVHSFWINWRLYQLSPQQVTPSQFYQVASARWVRLPSDLNRWRGPEPGVDKTVMYFNLRKNIGTFTWYGSVALPEHAVAKFLINEDGTSEEDSRYKGEIYCATVQSSDCEIEKFSITYNHLIINTGQNFKEPSKIIINFNYDPKWTTEQGTIVNQNGLLAVDLLEGNNRNRTIVLSYRDGRFLLGFSFFIVAVVLWPIWYFRYYRVE